MSGPRWRLFAFTLTSIEFAVPLAGLGVLTALLWALGSPWWAIAPGVVYAASLVWMAYVRSTMAISPAWPIWFKDLEAKVLACSQFAYGTPEHRCAYVDLLNQVERTRYLRKYMR